MSRRADCEREEEVPGAGPPGQEESATSSPGSGPSASASSMGNQAERRSVLRHAREPPFQPPPTSPPSTMSPTENPSPTSETGSITFVGPFGKKQRMVRQSSLGQPREDTSGSEMSPLSDIHEGSAGQSPRRKIPESPKGKPSQERASVLLPTPFSSNPSMSGVSSSPQKTKFRRSAPATPTRRDTPYSSPSSHPTRRILSRSNPHSPATPPRQGTPPSPFAPSGQSTPPSRHTSGRGRFSSPKGHLGSFSPGQGSPVARHFTPSSGPLGSPSWHAGSGSGQVTPASGRLTPPTPSIEYSPPASSVQFTPPTPTSRPPRPIYEITSLLPTLPPMEVNEPLNLSTQGSQQRTGGDGGAQGHYSQGQYFLPPSAGMSAGVPRSINPRQPYNLTQFYPPPPSGPHSYPPTSQGYPPSQGQYGMGPTHNSPTKDGRGRKKQAPSSTYTPSQQHAVQSASSSPAETGAPRRPGRPRNPPYYPQASEMETGGQGTAGESGTGSEAGGPVAHVLPQVRGKAKVAAAPAPPKKKYQCPDCKKEFSQLRNFRYHRSRHEGTKQFACTCPVCGKSFNDKGYLSSHLKIHRNAKEYKCEWCEKSFNQRVAYNMHIRIHTGLKPHQCHMCSKAFSRKMLLRQHLRTHTGERPYHCVVCGKSFADRSNMLLHQRLHTGDRPYKCEQCNKTFSKNHHLKTHMNHHLGIRPYHCPKCDACFSQSSNMKTHLKKCTGLKPSRNSPGPSSSRQSGERSPQAGPSHQSPASTPRRRVAPTATVTSDNSTEQVSAPEHSPSQSYAQPGRHITSTYFSAGMVSHIEVPPFSAPTYNGYSTAHPGQAQGQRFSPSRPAQPMALAASPERFSPNQIPQRAQSPQYYSPFGQVAGRRGSEGGPYGMQSLPSGQGFSSAHLSSAHTSSAHTSSAHTSSAQGAPGHFMLQHPFLHPHHLMNHPPTHFIPLAHYIPLSPRMPTTYSPQESERPGHPSRSHAASQRQVQYQPLRLHPQIQQPDSPEQEEASTHSSPPYSPQN